MCINLQRTVRGFAAICGAAFAFGGAAALTNAAFAQTPAAPAASTATPWTYQGLFDMYYLYDANKPTGEGAPGTQVTGFEYDQQPSTPTLSLAELNIAKAAPANGGIGFKTTLISGETASENVAGSQEARYENIQQLYITFAAKSGAGIDIGKFYTPFGYEVTESNANYNYSRSFIFTDLLPVYHTGLRAYTQSYKGLVITGYVVKNLQNGVLNSEGSGEGVYSNSKSVAFIGQLNYTAPSGKFVAVETYGGGSDGQLTMQDRCLLSDTDLTFTPNAVDTLGFNYTNKQDILNQAPGEQYNGYCGYYRRQLTSAYALAFRLEKDFAHGGGQSGDVDSFTLTGEDKATKSLLVRLELRHDDASSQLFTSGQAGVPVATQNTLSLSGVWTFGP